MKSNKKSGMSLNGVVLVVFVILKLVGVINWSWVWVLSPLWIGFPVALVLLVVVGVVVKVNEKRG